MRRRPRRGEVGSVTRNLRAGPGPRGFVAEFYGTFKGLPLSPPFAAVQGTGVRAQGGSLLRTKGAGIGEAGDGGPCWAARGDWVTGAQGGSGTEHGSRGLGSCLAAEDAAELPPSRDRDIPTAPSRPRAPEAAQTRKASEIKQNEAPLGGGKHREGREPCPGPGLGRVPPADSTGRVRSPQTPDPAVSCEGQAPPLGPARGRLSTRGRVPPSKLLLNPRGHRSLRPPVSGFL